MSSYTRRFNYLIFMASILLVLLCFLATGTVYADQVTITNENVYYQEGLDGIDGNEFSLQDINSVISHDESLVYINDLSNTRILSINNKLALIGSKEDKASFILLNGSFETVISYTQDVLGSIAVDLISVEDKYVLLTNDEESSYIVTFEGNGVEYTSSVEKVDGKYNEIVAAQDDFVLLNESSYKLGEDIVSLNNAIDVKIYNSNIYSLTYNEVEEEKELALNIYDLEENLIQSTKIGDTDKAKLYVNANGVFVNIEGEILKVDGANVESVYTSTNSLFIKDSIFDVASSKIDVYDYALDNIASVELKNALDVQDIVLFYSKIYAISNNNLYLISLDNREVVLSENLAYKANSVIDYAALATIENVDLTIDSSNIDVATAGDYKVIYSFEENNSTYYFYQTISITNAYGIDTDSLYLNPVALTVENGYATLNGEEYISGTTIENIGEYTLKVYANSGVELYSYDFAIINLDIKDNETYADSLILSIPEIDGLIVKNVDKEDNETILVNGENNALTKEGKNTLTVTYKESIYNFDYYIFNLENEEELSGGQYAYSEASALTLNFTENTSAIVKLNNVEINPAYSDFTYFGTYNLVVLNTENEIIKTATFTIDTKVVVGSTSVVFTNGVAKITGTSKSTTSAKITFELLAKDVKLNGNNAYSGMTTYNAGENTLVLQGLNGYNVSVVFTIDLTTNLINDYTYKGAVLPAISGGVLKLNDKPYTNGTLITTAGDYKLDIFSEANLTKAYKTITFTVLPETLNVSSQDSLNKDIFTSGVILASTNNKMFVVEGDEYTSDDIATAYLSNEVISTKGSFVFRLYYATYNGSLHATNEFGYSEDNGTYYVDYYFEVSVELGLNIKNNQEFEDQATILFAGADSAKLTYFGTENSINVQNGYILKTIGKYTIEVEQGEEKITSTFTVSPRLNVENSRTYLTSENITIVDAGYGFSVDGLNVSLSVENGSDASNIVTYTTLSDIVAKSLDSGTYQLILTSSYSDYEKVVNFIVVSQNILSRGATYDNGKAFEFDMYGVEVNLIAPQTGLSTYLETKYVEGSEILTVGKHYVSFIFTINGVTTSTDYVLTNDLVFQSGVTYYTKNASNEYEEASVVIGQSVEKDTYYVVAGTDSAIYFYVRPVIRYSQTGENLTRTLATSFATDESIVISITDGELNDYDSFDIDSTTQAFSTNALYQEIGKHTITITLGDIKYNISFTINTYFVEDGVEITQATTDTNRLVFEKEATFTTKTPAKITLDGDSVDVYNEEINTIGNHTLTIVGSHGYTKKLYIKIKEVVTFNSEKVNSTTDAVITKTTYSYDNQPVALHVYGAAESIKIINVAQSLSGKEFSNNNTNVGYYTILITGANKYTATYLFAILDDLKLNGEEPVGSYNKAVTISCENTSSMKLNIAKATNEVETKTIISGDTINVVGSYSITVNGVGSYVNTYTFAILNEVLYKNSAILDKTSLPTSLVSTSAVDLMFKNSDVIYASSTRNGEVITAFDRLNTIGQYNFVFIDANGNEINYGVTIQETLLFNGDAATNYTYTTLDKVTITNANDSVSFATIKLNNVNTELAQLANIATLGNNELYIETIDGNAKYTKTYTFVIKESVIGSEIFKTKELAKANAFDLANAPSYIFNNADLTYAGLSLDGQSATYNAAQITSFGLHNIVVKGVNSYKVTYYMYVNLDTSLINNNVYAYNSNDLIYTTNAINVIIDNNLNAIDTIGIHNVTFVGQSSEKETYVITVKEDMSIISGEYTSAISPKVFGTFEDVEIDVVNGFINGETELNTVGTYVLTVFGTNNYTSSYTYTLKDTLIYTSQNTLEATNLTPGDRIVDQSAILLNHVNSTLKYKKYVLNGKVVPALPGIELIGVNELVVTNINNESETYLFALGSDVWYTTIGVENNPLTTSLDVKSTGEVIVNQVSTNIYYTSYTLNGETVPVDSLLHVKIDTIGNNILSITDINGTSNTYKIIITETSDSTFEIFKNAADAKTNAYSTLDNVSASFGNDLGYSLTLDGNDYTKGSAINTFGTHKIEVVGVNDYVSTYYLYVNLDTNIENGKVYNAAVNVSANAEISANYNANYVGGKINQVGIHEITFKASQSTETITYEISILPISIGSTLYTSTTDAINNAYDDIDNVNANFGSDLTYTLKLDGKSYSKGAIINVYGYHEIKVYGFNYVSNPYYVFINLNTEIEDTYYDAILPSSNAKYYVLDNSSNITTAKAINSVGNHEIIFVGNTVSGIDAPATTFDFKILETSVGSSLYKTIALATHKANTYVFSDDACASFGTTLTYDILLDGSDYVIGAPIKTFGLHTIKVVGTNNYESTYYLYVNLYTTIENNAKYTNEVEIIANAEISANFDSEFVGGKLNVLGNHTITFKANATNEEIKYLISINEESLGSTLFDSKAEALNNAYEYSDNINASFADTAIYTIKVDGNNYSKGSVINTYGMHEIKVLGYNYESNPYYVFINLYTTLENGKEYLCSDPIFTTYKTNANAELDDNSTSLSQVGNHIITFVGNSVDETIYSENYHITTKEVSTGSEIFKDKTDAINNAYTYSLAPSVAFEGADIENILLDGSTYTQNEAILGYGVHTITLSGVNGYTSIYFVCIKLYTNIIDGYTYKYNANALKTFTTNAYEYILDDNSTSLTEIGNHYITFKGIGNKEETFVITVEEINDKISGSVFKPTTIDIKGLTETTTYSMDAIDFVNGDTLNKLGRYTLKIFGVNGYESTYNYVLSDEVCYKAFGSEEDVALVNGAEINLNTAITVSQVLAKGLSYKKVVFNGEEINGLPINVDKVGKNVLKLTNINDEELTYTFNLSTKILYTGDNELPANTTLNIKEPINIYEENADLRFVSYTLNGVTYNVTGALNVLINTIGLNELKLLDLNGNVYTYSILYTESYEGNTLYLDEDCARLHAYDYESSPSATFNTNAKLDGVTYLGEKIKGYGLHEIVITGINGYESHYFVFVNLYTTILKGNTYVESIEDIFANADIELDGVAFNGNSLNTIGNHTFRFISKVSQDEATFNVCIKENVLGIINNGVYSDVKNVEIKGAFEKVIINNEEFNANNYTFNKVGTYELKVQGVNGYESGVYTFELTNNILYTNNESNDASLLTYAEDASKVTLTLENEDVTYSYYELNGVEINALKDITTIGNNVLKVRNINGEEKTFNIAIVEESVGSEIFTNKAVAKNNAYAMSNNAYVSFGDKLVYNVTVDGSDYVIGTPINIYGLHEIKVFGVNNFEVTYYLYVDLFTTIENEDENIYTYKFDIISNAESVLIDGVESDITSLYEVGNHAITFKALSGEETTYPITIKEIVNGLDKTEYLNETIVIESGYDRLTLNGEEYITGTKITRIGNYRLDVYGTNGYHNVYNFTNYHKAPFEPNKEYLGSTAIVVENADLFIDNEAYTSSTEYFVTGKHVLTIKGEGGYIEEIPFVIIPNIKESLNVEDNRYVARFNLLDANNNEINALSKVVVFIDSVPYTLNDNYTIVGYHTLDVMGSNGYKYSVDFLIEAYLPVVDGETYNTKITLTMLDANMSLDDKVLTNNLLYLTELTHL